MEWKEYYTTLMLDSDGSDGCGEGLTFLTIIDAMANRTGLDFLFTTRDMDDANGDIIPEKLNDAPRFTMIIIEMAATERRKPPFVRITATTSGELPQGIRHGTYTFEMNGDAISETLPPEMFEDGEVKIDDV